MSSFLGSLRQGTGRLMTRFTTPTVRFFLGRYYGRPVPLFVDAGKCLAALHLFCAYGYDWGSVSGPSMLPGWSVWGEGAIISNRHRRGRDIEVGDLVRFKIPVDDGVAIKRVLGLAGDYVMMGTPETGRDSMIQVRQRRER
ncbi:Mitochondrial inner membrane peptidase complex subunit [Diaporthe australafricana]|uniref:Mitochondrial inner membrane peptidase complex subunit n=1 Tax=Diaporthe australafricana TaxID=127596 RepID=A0ABR3Y1Z8_9PEZI